MLLYLDSRNPNNSYYEDRGLLAFWNCGSEQGSTSSYGQVGAVGSLRDGFFHRRPEG